MLLCLLALLAAGGPPKWVKEVAAPPGSFIGQGHALSEALSVAVTGVISTSHSEGTLVRVRGMEIDLRETNDAEITRITTHTAAPATALAEALRSLGFQWEKYVDPKTDSVWVLLKAPKDFKAAQTDASRALLAELESRPAEGTPAWVKEKRPEPQGGKGFSGLGRGTTLAEAVADAMGQVAEGLRAYTDQLAADYAEKPAQKGAANTRTRTRDAEVLPRYLEAMAKKARVQTHCENAGARLCHALVVWSL